MRPMAGERTNLTEVTVIDHEATGRLQATGLPIVRVERHPSGIRQVTWRYAPTPEQEAVAVTLLGGPIQSVT